MALIEMCNINSPLLQNHTVLQDTVFKYRYFTNLLRAEEKPFNLKKP